MQDADYTAGQRTGPEERRWTARLHYRVFGRWPASVVAERLAYVPPMSENVKVIMREVYTTAGHPVPPEYRRDLAADQIDTPAVRQAARDRGRGLRDG